MKFSDNIKWLSVLLVVMIANIGIVGAVPVYPLPIKIKQKDGSVVTIRAYGDERFNYATTSDGYHVISKDGNLYYATINGTEFVSTGVLAKDPAKRDVADKAVLSTVTGGYPYQVAGAKLFRSTITSYTYETAERNTMRLSDADSEEKEFRSLVILVDFKDKPFSLSNEDTKMAFERLLNENGYSDNGATGSARDYYMDNSGGKFKPNFDVVGPFTLSKGVRDYSSGDPVQFVTESMNIATSSGIDLSPYIVDGKLRDVFIFYAGYNNAETGTGEFIHPARVSYINGYPLGVWGGARLLAAAYTSELTGSSGATRAGIGTFCHEFGHIMGWPDFYDTNYQENGTGFNLDVLSLMASGSYVNEGRTPPSFSAYERYLAGWLELQEINQEGELVIEPVYGNKGYVMNTFNTGEMFVFEYRNGSLNKWDNVFAVGDTAPGTGFPVSGGGSGMLVYHIDRSANTVESRRASALWNANKVNAYGNHECMRLLMASQISRPSRNGALSGLGKIFFPGSNNITQLTSSTQPYFIAWNGFTPGYEFFNIKENAATNVTLTVRKVAGGTIKNFAVSAGQTNVSASYASPFDDEFMIICEGNGKKYTITTNDNVVNFSGLKQGTNYKVTIKYAKTGQVIESKEITTTTPMSNRVPTLKINNIYMSMDYIVLGYNNVPSDIKSEKWYIDNVEQEKTAVLLKSGTHKVVAEITTSDGVEYLVKYVTVQ